MKAPLASSALVLALASAWPASAQQTGNGLGTSALSRSMGSAPKKDDRVGRAGVAPDLPPMDTIEGPKVPLPASLNPDLLLQKENGPFMVNAYAFVGPDAAKYAQLLVVELRRDYKLPAYIWYARIQPSRTNIRRVQPTADDHVRNGDMAPPESFREKDEALVLVGDCKTIDEAYKLRDQVKKIKPVALEKLPSIYTHRKGKGLFRATVTTNPFQAAQNLFPGHANVAGMPSKNGEKFDPSVAISKFEQAHKVDPFVKGMNTSSYSIFKNKADYTLVVAEFGGRTTVQLGSENVKQVAIDRRTLERSPLMTAHEDAEMLAEALSKCSTLKGYRPYTYHSRNASYVTLGSFGSEKDPAAEVVRRMLPKISQELIQNQFSRITLLPTEKLMMVPHDR